MSQEKESTTEPIYGLTPFDGLRYYNPSLQRWTTRDPLGEQGGVNLYTYCGNDPVNKIDAFGLDLYLVGIPPVVADLGFQPDAIMRATYHIHGPITDDQAAWFRQHTAPGSGSEQESSTWTELLKILSDPDGYTACYANCMLFGTAVKTAAELGGATYVARKYYTSKYPRWFKAGGKHSRVLVPRFAQAISLSLVIVSVTHEIECVRECSRESSGDNQDVSFPACVPYEVGRANAPPAL